MNQIISGKVQRLKICNIVPLMKVSLCENPECRISRKCSQESLFKRDTEMTKQMNDLHKFILRISKNH